MKCIFTFVVLFFCLHSTGVGNNIKEKSKNNFTEKCKPGHLIIAFKDKDSKFPRTQAYLIESSIHPISSIKCGIYAPKNEVYCEDIYLKGYSLYKGKQMTIDSIIAYTISLHSRNFTYGFFQNRTFAVISNQSIYDIGEAKDMTFSEVKYKSIVDSTIGVEELGIQIGTLDLLINKSQTVMSKKRMTILQNSQARKIEEKTKFSPISNEEYDSLISTIQRTFVHGKNIDMRFLEYLIFNGQFLCEYKNSPDLYGSTTIFNKRINKKSLNSLLQLVKHKKFTQLIEPLTYASLLHYYPEGNFRSFTIKEVVELLYNSREYLVKRSHLKKDLLDVIDSYGTKNNREDYKYYPTNFIELWLISELSGCKHVLSEIVDILVKEYYPELLVKKRENGTTRKNGRILIPVYFTHNSFSLSRLQVENTLNIFRGRLYTQYEKIVYKRDGRSSLRTFKDDYSMDEYIISMEYLDSIHIPENLFFDFDKRGSHFFNSQLNYFVLHKDNNKFQWKKIPFPTVTRSFKRGWDGTDLTVESCLHPRTSKVDTPILYTGLPSGVQPKGYKLLFRNRSYFENKYYGVNDTMIVDKKFLVTNGGIKSFSLSNTEETGELEQSLSVTLHSGKEYILYMDKGDTEGGRREILNVYTSDVNGDGYWDIICHSTHGGKMLFIQLPYGGFEKRVIEKHWYFNH